MSGDSPENRSGEPPWSQLERALIDEFLGAHGHDHATLAALPAADRDRLLAAASLHASSRLAEVEARSHLLEDFHHGAR